MDIGALWLTLKLATITTLILLAITIPLAGWLVLSRARWKPLIEAISALPLLLPPTVLGFYLLVLLGPRTAIGRGYSAIFGHPLTFTFAGLVLGSVIYSFPFALQPLASGFASIDPAVMDAAALLGARPARLLLRILLPLAKRSMLTAAVLAFTHTIG